MFRSARKRSWKLRIASLISVVLTLELATRLFRPGHLNKSQFDPDVGYLLQPNMRVMMTDRESQVTHEFTANSLGFRGSEWLVPKPSGLKRIAVLGDSYVEARAYEEHRIFCGRLQQLLNESSPDERWEVMNLGVQGHNTSSQLAVYEKFAKPLDPDLVILCVTLSNDIRENVRELSNCYCVFKEFEDDGQIRVTLPQRQSDLDFKSQFKFYLWQKAKIQTAVDYLRTTTKMSDVYDPLAMTRKKKLEEARCLTEVPLDPRYVHAWSVTSKLLEMFRNRVEHDGSRFYVVSLPNAWQVHDELFERMRNAQPDPRAFVLDQPIEQLGELSGRLGIDLLELTPAFRDELATFRSEYPTQRSSDLLFLRGIGHFSERAHQVVARELFRFLQSNEPSDTRTRSDVIADNVTDESKSRQ